METPVSFAHLIGFLAILSSFLPLCHRILPIVSPVSDIFKTPGMAIAIPAILVSPPLNKYFFHISFVIFAVIKLVFSLDKNLNKDQIDYDY